MSKLQMWQIQQRQALPLDMKEGFTARRIKNWYGNWQGQVYVSFSGGKDSTVLLHQVRKLYPDVPAVFVNTGQEYGEIIKFVKTIKNVIWLKPKMTFWEVVEKYGWPVANKRQARYINDIQRAHEGNKATVSLRLTGYNRKGIYCPTMKLAKKWTPLVKCGFKISDKCCDILKKLPLDKYAKESQRKPFTAMMSSESNSRLMQYKKQGCNAFNIGKPISWPMAFWNEDNIWEYIKKYDLPYSDIYDKGETRTGCKYCMFGVHMEKEPNRFQRMAKRTPGQFENFRRHGGCDVLDVLKVNYEEPKLLFK
jgi:3'-phosphoadenosine 5'-phosphosulfate sulfotransferase (PAPS reductase)/FAD synthetase